MGEYEQYDERGKNVVDAVLPDLERLNAIKRKALEKKGEGEMGEFTAKTIMHEKLRKEIETNSRLTKELEEARKLNDQLTDRIYHLKRILSRTALIAREALSGWRRLQTVYGNYLDRTENDAL